MHLATPNSAILSAVIFNALIIVALIPLPSRVKYRPLGAGLLLRRNLLIYGLGGSSCRSRNQADRHDLVVGGWPEEKERCLRDS